MASVPKDLEQLAKPFKKGPAQGEDPKYDPLFFDLQGQVENIAGGTADWEKIETISVEILKSKAKDLRVVAFLCAALCKRHDLAGLKEGLRLLRKLVETQWDGLHPQRERQRGTALEWILLRVPDYVEDIEAKEPDREALGAALEDALWLDPETRKLLGPEAPSFAPLIGILQSSLRRLGPDPAAEPDKPAPAGAKESKKATPKADSGKTDTGKTEDVSADEPTDESAQEAAQEAPAAPKPAPRAPTPQPVQPSRPAEPLPEREEIKDNATVQELKNRFRSLIPHLRKADPGHVLAYRVSRMLKWAELAGPPPRKEGNATLVPVPRQQQREALSGLLAGEQWPQLLEASEGAFQADSGTFWIDLQRYSALALEGMGASEAAEVVVGELRELLKRYPELERLSFAGGEVPFAAPETRRWIEGAVRKMDVGMIQLGGGDAAQSMIDDEATREIKSFFATKNIAGALNLLQECIAKAGSPKSRFHTRLTAARLCLEANRLPWARNLLEDMAREADTFEFDEWESGLAVQFLHLQALCYGRLAKTAEGEQADRLREDLAEVQARLFRLDLRPIALIEDALGDDESRGSWWRLGR